MPGHDRTGEDANDRGNLADQAAHETANQGEGENADEDTIEEVHGRRPSSGGEGLLLSVRPPLGDGGKPGALLDKATPRRGRGIDSVRNGPTLVQ
jgi:hypothetical protein